MANSDSTSLASSSPKLTFIRSHIECAEQAANTASMILRLKHELYCLKQGDGNGMDWYSDFFEGALDDAARICAERAHAETMTAGEQMDSPEPRN